MKNKHIFILIALIIFASVFIDQSEKFAPYRTLIGTDLEKWRTGSTPMSRYYSYPAYRKPYRNGFKFYKSYPYPHMASINQ